MTFYAIVSLLSGKPCFQMDLFTAGCNAYAIFIAELAGHSNVSSDCKFISDNVVYLGDNETVRGIPVQKWSQCVLDSRTKTVSVSYFYYNKAEIAPPAGDPKTPIRFENRVLSNISECFRLHIDSVSFSKFR